MTSRPLLPIALMLALCLACSGHSMKSQEAGTTPPALQERSNGAESDFPDPATYAHKLDDPAREAWQKPGEVIGLLDVRRGSTTVDLGTGTGYFLPYLSAAAGAGGRVVALDTSASAIRLVEARIEEEGLANVEVRQVGAADPGLRSRSVDRILVVNTWHHISNRSDYAKRLEEALRPGGRLLIIDFDMDSPVGPDPTKRLTPDGVLEELRAAGFATERLDESLPYQYAIVGRRL